MPFNKLLGFTKDVQDLPDKPNSSMTAAQLKEWFDSAPNELRAAFNQLIDDLQSVLDGTSGADNIGVTPIGESPTTVQEVLEWLKVQNDSILLGQIPDGSITVEKLAFDPVEEFTPNINTSKVSTNYYIDTALGADTPFKGNSSGAGAFKTIVYALSQMKTLNVGRVYLNIAAGTYNETVNITGFHGADLVLRQSGGIPTIDSIFISNSDEVNLTDLIISGGVSVTNTKKFVFSNLSKTTTTTGNGISVIESRGKISGCTISNCTSSLNGAVKASGGSHVFIENLAGTGNALGLHSASSIIQRLNVTMTATTATSLEAGGQIW